jgi:hypothetical protein
MNDHRIAKEVEHQIARSAETNAFEPMDACDAYDEWRSGARDEWRSGARDEWQSGARDDLLGHGYNGESRSTNVISNVLEHVWYATIARHVSQDGRYFL